MPSLEEHQSAHTTKLLLVGNNGSGKTGSLASLADAGYNLFIVDLDNGVDVLANLLRSKAYDPAAIKRVDVHTLTDKMKGTKSGMIQPSAPKVWKKMVDLLDNWPGKGNIANWTPQDVLVIDSLTFAAKAALQQILFMNNRLGQKPWIQDIGAAQDLLESLFQMLYDVSIPCNVIVNCHIALVDDEEGTSRGYPASVGNKLGPKIGGYFNTILRAKAKGKQRLLYTQDGGLIELKTSAPGAVAPTYPIETGLAQYFKAVRNPNVVYVPPAVEVESSPPATNDGKTNSVAAEG